MHYLAAAFLEKINIPKDGCLKRFTAFGSCLRVIFYLDLRKYCAGNKTENGSILIEPFSCFG